MSVTGIGSGARWAPRRMMPLACGLILAASGLLVAQSPTARNVQTQPTLTAEGLPVRRVLLYKNGIGYFEHIGRVRGNQTVTVDFTTSQLDDVLASMTVLDLGGGRISGVSYNSEAALDHQLETLRVSLGTQTTRTQFLSAMRGTRIEVRTGGARVAGRLLDVERIDRRIQNVASTIDAVVLITDAGEMQTLPLDPGVGVRVLDAGLNQEVGRYLSLLSSASARDSRRMTISTAGAGERDLFVSYVSEVPVWKATYRLVLPDAGTTTSEPLLQGWAIVDNTIGQDWDNVQLSLVAGAPQSFVQAISRPYYVQRPAIPLSPRLLSSPQTHQAAMIAAGTSAITGTIVNNVGVVQGATVRIRNAATGQVWTSVTDAQGIFRIASIPPATYAVTINMQGFKAVDTQVTLSAGEVRNLNRLTLSSGGVSETVNAGCDVFGTLSVNGGNSLNKNTTIDGVLADMAGANGLARIDSVAAVPAARAAQQVDADGAPLGDLFEYKVSAPVTLRKNTSALVPILNAAVQAEKVSLWNPSTGAHPLRAVWLTNKTGATLEGGSFTVIEGQAFAGEGLLEPLRADERRLLSYASDPAVTVAAKDDPARSRVTQVRVSRGALIETTEEQHRRTYTVRNEGAETRVLVIEHPVRVGWTLGGSTTPVETTPGWHRFRVPVDAKGTVSLTIDESRPSGTEVALQDLTDDRVELLVRSTALDAGMAAALRDVLSRKADIARLNGEIAARDAEIEQISADQTRLRGNMQVLKGSGAERKLLQRYVTQLGEQETRLDVVRQERARLAADSQRAQTELATFIDGLSL